MKIRTMNYMLKQSFVSIWRNRGMSVASVASVMASLTVLGVIITIVLNVNNLSEIAQMQFDTIQVFLDEELGTSDISDLGEKIGSIKGVNFLDYETKEEALNRMKEQWGDKGYLLEVLEENTLPNSYIIHLENIEVADDVVKNLNTLEGIEEIKYHKEILDTMMGIANFVRTIGLALIIVLILITMFIIANTIKLTLNARRQEINIMKYVGATNWFIRWPFFIEGIVLGLIGSVIALGIVYFGYEYVFDLISNKFHMMLSIQIVPVKEMINRTLPIFTVLGAGIGALGSILSLRKHLRV